MELIDIFWAHSLTILWILPLIGIGFVLCCSPSWSVGIGLTTATITFVFSIFLGLHMDFSNLGYQFMHSHPWISTLGAFYRVGVDGLSYPFIVLTTFLFLMTHMVHFSIQESLRGFFTLLLLIESSFLGLFVSLDIIQFLIFWGVIVTSFYFLLALFGQKTKDLSPNKFIGYASVAILLCLASVGALVALNSSGILNFEEFRNIKSAPLYIFILLGIGFSMMGGIFPFHSWFLDMQSKLKAPATIPSSCILWIGLYGWIRLITPLFPNYAVSFSMVLSIWFLIHFLYMSLRQLYLASGEEQKTFIHYIPLSLTGFILLAICSLKVEALHGAYLMLFSYTMVAILLYGFPNIFKNKFFGTASYWALGMAPLFSLFTALILIVFGLFQGNQVLTFIALMGVLIYVISVFWIYQKQPLETNSTNRYEIALVCILLGLLLVLGCYPNFLTMIIKDSTDEWIQMGIRMIQASS